MYLSDAIVRLMSLWLFGVLRFFRGHGRMKSWGRNTRTQQSSEWLPRPKIYVVTACFFFSPSHEGAFLNVRIFYICRPSDWYDDGFVLAKVSD